LKNEKTLGRMRVVDSRGRRDLLGRKELRSPQSMLFRMGASYGKKTPREKALPPLGTAKGRPKRPRHFLGKPGRGQKRERKGDDTGIFTPVEGGPKKTSLSPYRKVEK